MHDDCTFHAATQHVAGDSEQRAVFVCASMLYKPRVCCVLGWRLKDFDAASRVASTWLDLLRR